MLNVAKSILYLDVLVNLHHCGYRCHYESISACVIVKSALTKIYQLIFFQVWLSVKFRDKNHINSFLENFVFNSELNDGFYATHVKTVTKTIWSVFSLKFSL